MNRVVFASQGKGILPTAQVGAFSCQFKFKTFFFSPNLEFVKLHNSLPCVSELIFSCWITDNQCSTGHLWLPAVEGRLSVDLSLMMHFKCFFITAILRAFTVHHDLRSSLSKKHYSHLHTIVHEVCNKL